MPKRTDIHKILVIGSGPIVIGQAAEFDYAGSQACQSLREEGYEVILINSNPATIMTDTAIADRVYIEPINLDFAKRVIYKERPDAILGSLGGQTGLNLVVELHEDGILDEYGVGDPGNGPSGHQPCRGQGAVPRADAADRGTGPTQPDRAHRRGSGGILSEARLSGGRAPCLYPWRYRRRLCGQ